MVFHPYQQFNKVTFSYHAILIYLQISFQLIFLQKI